jgi:hypothetical protein
VESDKSDASCAIVDKDVWRIHGPRDEQRHPERQLPARRVRLEMAQARSAGRREIRTSVGMHPWRPG